MKKLWATSGYAAAGIIIILFLLVSYLSLSSIHTLQGNARVVNFVGIVRGATQKLIKEELMGIQDDELIARLDTIVEELLTGEGPNNLVVLQDENYLEHMGRVQQHWNRLKEQIYDVRAGAPPQELFDSSQEYFDLVNETVFAAEAFSEAQVQRIYGMLVGVDVIFVLFIVGSLVLIVRGMAVKRRADALGKIAYVDSLTHLDNRASCERLITVLRENPPADNIAAFMFDMNDLKLTNDFLGHQGGDKIISDFAGILKQAAAPYGFIGRYGGDEFLGIFQNATQSMAKEFMDEVASGVSSYNEVCLHALEKINYAAGYTLDSAKATRIEDIIAEADSRMYEDKRSSKRGRA